MLALLGAPHFLHVSRIRVKLLTFRLLMSYIYIYIYIYMEYDNEKENWRILTNEEIYANIKKPTIRDNKAA